MILSCDDVIARISLLLDGADRAETDSAREAREEIRAREEIEACQQIEAHVAHCARCRELAESLRQIRARCRSFRMIDQPRPIVAADRAKLLAAYHRDRERLMQREAS